MIAVIMGCTPSIPDPNVMYADGRRSNTSSGATPNNVHVQKATPRPDTPGAGRSDDNASHTSKGSGRQSRSPSQRAIKGDLWVYQNSKQDRHRKIRSANQRNELLAQEMVSKVMDDKERFSLSTSRSRTTSRAPSPKPFQECDKVTISVGSYSVASVSEVPTPDDLEAAGPSGRVQAPPPSVRLGETGGLEQAASSMADGKEASDGQSLSGNSPDQDASELGESTTSPQTQDQFKKDRPDRHKNLRTMENSTGVVSL